MSNSMYSSSNGSACDGEPELEYGQHADTDERKGAIIADGRTALPEESLSGDCKVVRRHRHRHLNGEQQLCAVCSDAACGYNFDALTCHSCKLFFRRNAFRTLSCPFNKSCHIDKVRRKFCAACRLSKCFEAKMKREFIRVPPSVKSYDNRTTNRRKQEIGKQEDDISDEEDDETFANQHVKAEPSEIVNQRSDEFSKNSSTVTPLRNATPEFLPSAATSGRYNSIGTTGPIVQLDSVRPVATVCASSTTFEPDSPNSYLFKYIPEEIESLSEFEYDKMLMACTNGWRIAISPVNSTEYEDAVRNCRQNAQMSLLGSMNNTLFHYFSYLEILVRRTVAAFKQVPDFRALSPNSQMKLLQAATLSVLNVSGVFLFNAELQEWVIKMTNGEERHIPIREVVPPLETLGELDVSDYMLQYTCFHTELRQVFANDNVILFIIVLLDLFSPFRFKTTDPEMYNVLSAIHSKYVVFLKRYIKRHYKPVTSSSGPMNGSTSQRGFVSMATGGIMGTSRQPEEVQSQGNELSNSACSSSTRIAFRATSDMAADSNRPLSRSAADSDTQTLIRFVLSKLNDRARCLEAYLMRLSARMLANGMSFSPLVREVFQIAENTFECQLNVRGFSRPL